MARAENTQLVDRFQTFYREYYKDALGELARQYPTGKKSLVVEWQDLYQFDPDLADDVRSQPGQLREYAEEALRLYDLPVDVSLSEAHVRVTGLPDTTEIREIRADHRGRLIAVQGIVRKATDVRPKITNAAFECQRCGTLTRIPQSGGDFQEPHECQGCERQGPFRVNFDQSTFIDAQKIRVQESPEGLRGGETPQAIDIGIEDDITGDVTAGDHVTVTGILKLDQQGNDREQSPMFDVYMDGMTIDIEDEQFEEMDITDEEKARIVELSNDPDIYEKVVGAIAPSIYGYDDQKLAMALQLFSGVTKHLPDGSRIRGDLHMLLIGDPGTGKCLKGDEKVLLADGAERTLRSLVEANLSNPKPVDDGVYGEVDIRLPTMDQDGEITLGRATRVWKREAPKLMYRIRTRSGEELEVTPSHPLFVQADGSFETRCADDLSEGQYVAVPEKVTGDWSDELDVDFRRSKANNAVHLDLPDLWTESLARLIGYIIAEGHAQLHDNHTGDVRITNADSEIIADVSGALDDLGLTYTIDEVGARTSTDEVRCTSGEFASFLYSLEPAILDESSAQRIPDALKSTSPNIKRAFLRAYMDAEGHVSTKQRELAVASTSRQLLEDVRTLLLVFGISSVLENRANGSFRLRISGADFVEYAETIGFITDRKSRASRAFENVPRNTNTDVVPGLGEKLRQVREALGLTQAECGLPRSTYQHYERGDRNPSKESLQSVVDAFEERIAWLRTVRRRVRRGDWDAIRTVRRELKISQAQLADRTPITQTAVSYYERNELVPDGGILTAASSEILDRISDAISIEDDVEHIRNFVESDVAWDRIQSIDVVEPNYDWVYDLEVAETHNYVTNNILSHNSQLLQYVRNIAPRSVYTSGKGASTAGLTAAAVRDDFGDGQQWTLEAGALVLADQGIAAVDELDKMNPEDRSAMHEALEQQSISISKAGINATLKARCSLLGAANPKYGRFDQYEPIAEQIDLEPALISRFDLIFTVTDEPDAERDGALADHIIKTNYAGELHTHREQITASNHAAEEVEAATDDVSPTIDPEFLRKYVAYSKRTCFPTMTEAAKSEIRDFYVDLRARGADDDAPVPVTARKLEALVRLAEASARIRLSDTVEVEDAERATDIVLSCLKEIGMDPETGQFDADVIETGTTKSQRDRIKSLKALITDIEDEYDEGAPVDVVIERAEEAGMEPETARHEIEQLKQKGEVYEPRTDHLRTT